MRLRMKSRSLARPKELISFPETQRCVITDFRRDTELINDETINPFLRDCHRSWIESRCKIYVIRCPMAYELRSEKVECHAIVITPTHPTTQNFRIEKIAAAQVTARDGDMRHCVETGRCQLWFLGQAVRCSERSS